MQGGHGPGICIVDTGASESLEQVMTWTQVYCVSTDDPAGTQAAVVALTSL